MNTIEGVGSFVGKGELTTLTDLMELSGRVADVGLALLGTEEVAKGMLAMELSDQIAETAGSLASLRGYTIEEVIAPLWRYTDPAMTREG